MLLKGINKVLGPIGLQLIKNGEGYADAMPHDPNDYALYTYTKPDGSFDYERYRKIQEDGNKLKINSVWAIEENISFLADYLKKQLPSEINFGICHGTRRGKEQEWFRKYLGSGAEVIGTEISETAKEFPNTIQWDFHQVKDEWRDNVDFIYSNSFDHSYNPEMCLNAWMSCVRKGGLCILEHTDAHGVKGANELDPFGAHIMQMPYLVAKWGAGRYSVREILKAPQVNGSVTQQSFIVITRH